MKPMTNFQLHCIVSFCLYDSGGIDLLTPCYYVVTQITLFSHYVFLVDDISLHSSHSVANPNKLSRSN